ncbi:MAG: hypothetical protein ACO1N2_00695 [Candidatus Saccharimonadota bacterium]
MQIHTMNSYLEQYIEGYLLEDLTQVHMQVKPNAHPGNAAYLMTSAICSGIDFLGSLVTERQITPACEHCNKPEQVRNKFPFEHYCKYYLAKVDKRYENLGPVLRELIRNGIAHSFATKGKIGITRVVGDEDLHLVRMTEEGFLVINADRFFTDFKESYFSYFKPAVEKDESLKSLALDNYNHSKAVKEHEIERSMKAVEGKLETWPWLHQDIETMDHMIEQVESEGGLHFVS